MCRCSVSTGLKFVSIIEIITFCSTFLLQKLYGLSIFLKFQSSSTSTDFFAFSGIVVPEDSHFGVANVRALIGGRRIVDVMDCRTNQIIEMSLREFERYFYGKERTRIYDVIALEFSKSRLDPLVHRPLIVDHLDWIDLAWPRHLKFSPMTEKSDGFNYPKVQKYCLISAAGSFNDFHIGFGGSSLWYHVFRGEKRLWLISPTDSNFELYERWVKSGNQKALFFGDLVSICQCVTLEQSDTIIIPGGWIYATYASKDSIVFSGNFLSSFNIPMQLKVFEFEKKMGVPNQFRFPFFREIHWYALERYVHTLTSKTFLNDEFQNKNALYEKKCESLSEDKENDKVIDHVHLTPYEYKGLQKLIEVLENLLPSERNVPDGIISADDLLEAGKQLLSKHSSDDSNLAISGKPKAYWPESIQPNGAPRKRPKPKVKLPPKPPQNAHLRKIGSSRVRRVRCKQCDACLRDDCRECVFCRDMRKHGGPGTMKQTCIKRRCLNPILPSSVTMNGGEAAVQTAVKPLLEPPNTGRKEKRPSETEESPTSPKIPKLDFDTPRIEDDGFDDNFDDRPVARPSLPTVVNKIPDEELIKYPIRPASVFKREADSESDSQLSEKDKATWTCVIRYMSQKDLCNCMLVCKDFLRLCGSPKYWLDINLTGKRIKPAALQCLVRRSPKSLNLSQTNISYRQLLWLLERSPGLRKLFLVGCSWSAVAALATAACPPLQVIDLSWTTGVTDSHIKHLVSTPKDARPGQELTHTRLRHCYELSLAGTDVSDKGLKLLCQQLPRLKILNISFCNITNDGISHLINSNLAKSKSLTAIIAQHCHNLTDGVMSLVERLHQVTEIDFRCCCRISTSACDDFVNKSNGKLKLLEPLHVIGLKR